MSESTQPSPSPGLPTNSPAMPNASESSSPPQESNFSEPKPSYVKLAMRNMVRKRGKSLYHFALTTIGLLAVLIGLAYLTR
ncbi:DUF3285 domain-containing protein [Thermocoleostomius sinensis A174]|jgi:hypothetical protein|uniref:DUF3285 domain-containing protein n=2 Tax=Thermocoleostomius TaxID=3065395 RepID=A0A9E8ZDH3_9CYAN|nr:DUF3285 domain-containing protein [Thermocoleostomius sinensis A174]